MIQYSTQLNKENWKKRRKEEHLMIRQEKRRMEKKKIEKYNPKEFFRHCKTLKIKYKLIMQFVVHKEED
jgi:hypothetical protein